MSKVTDVTLERLNGTQGPQRTTGEPRPVNTGKYVIQTPYLQSFSMYGLRFAEGEARTEDEALARKIVAEYPDYRLIEVTK